MQSRTNHPRDCTNANTNADCKKEQHAIATGCGPYDKTNRSCNHNHDASAISSSRADNASSSLLHLRIENAEGDTELAKKPDKKSPGNSDSAVNINIINEELSAESKLQLNSTTEVNNNQGVRMHNLSLRPIDDAMLSLAQDAARGNNTGETGATCHYTVAMEDVGEQAAVAIATPSDVGEAILCTGNAGVEDMSGTMTMALLLEDQSAGLTSKSEGTVESKSSIARRADVMRSLAYGKWLMKNVRSVNDKREVHTKAKANNNVTQSREDTQVGETPESIAPSKFRDTSDRDLKSSQESEEARKRVALIACVTSKEGETTLCTEDEQMIGDAVVAMLLQKGSAELMEIHSTGRGQLHARAHRQGRGDGSSTRSSLQEYHEDMKSNISEAIGSAFRGKNRDELTYGRWEDATLMSVYREWLAMNLECIGQDVASGAEADINGTRPTKTAPRATATDLVCTTGLECIRQDELLGAETDTNGTRPTVAAPQASASESSCTEEVTSVKEKDNPDAKRGEAAPDGPSL
jgi:hypothetical protein